MDPFEKFNNTASEFLSKMSSSFPQETKIREYKLLFDGMRILNSRTPVELFMSNLEPFGEQILTKNELFFKNDEYIKEAENISGKLGLVDIWESIDTPTKGAIWSYIQSLYVIGMKCLGKEEILKALMVTIKTKNA